MQTLIEMNCVGNLFRYKWLFDTMAASTADYLWVAGHYPVYSACSHGPTQELINKLKPELEKHGAHYMCGHDHCQGHITESDVQYVVAGAGMECCYGVDNVGKVPKDSIKFWMGGSQGKGYQPMPGGIVPKSGFASFQIGADSMKVVYHSDGGEVLYTTDPILPRKK
jgi:acid phosphatase/tartrate-resistant acid phosphatase type 5